MQNEGNSILSRISRMDLFTTLIPGFYIMILLEYLYLSSIGNSVSLSYTISYMSLTIQKNPFVLIFILFGTYLFGSLTRSLKVNWAEMSFPPFRAIFPFEKQMLRILKEFHDSHKVGNFDINSLPELSGYNENFYNYWKDTLCIAEPVGFHYYESYEIRSRFAAGMVWSGICGLAVCILTRLMFCSPFEPYIFTSSLVLYVSFAVLLKRAREQEAKVLFFMHISCLQKNLKSII